MIRTLKRAWIPIVLVVVAVVAGFTVHRLRSFFGAEGILVTPKVFADDKQSFDPKIVRYEVFGAGGSALSLPW